MKTTTNEKPTQNLREIKKIALDLLPGDTYRQSTRHKWKVVKTRHLLAGNQILITHFGPNNCRQFIYRDDDHLTVLTRTYSNDIPW